MTRRIRCSFVGAVSLVLVALSLAQASAAGLSAARTDHDNMILPVKEDLTGIWSPDDWKEIPGATHIFPPVGVAGFGTFAPSAQQQNGILSGRIVFMNSGHGWTWFGSAWDLQRGVGNEMNEDYGNLDQLQFFAQYCFNAGATVVSMRPLGHQTNEIILDNDDAAVTWAGTWTDSSSPIFWGNPGDVAYRFASLSGSETATATYTPTIPVAGFYPVYCWTRHGSDRGDQLYRIRHTGGETQIRIPHYLVGNGWVYLGEYYFNAGANTANGSVVISNFRGNATGSVVIADAIRFGNGMGSVDRGGGVSDYPREEENMRYWVQANLAQGQSTSLYEGSGDDESDSWSSPGKMSAEMSRGPSLTATNDIDYKRIHISFHSNAGTGSSRGTEALITGDTTPHQVALAQIAGQEVNDDLVALGAPPLEYAWDNNTTVTYTGGYGEISSSYFNDEMDATIIEVAYHDNAIDAALLRDAKARAAVGKAAMHAVVKYFNQFDTNTFPPLLFLPEPPANVRALSSGTNGSITLSWTASANSGGSQSATNFLIYRSTNGYGFGNPISVGNVTSFTITNLAPNVAYYFRVSGANGGGESMPSEVVGCRAPSSTNTTKVLFVNAYDRFDRTQNLRMDLGVENYNPPDATGTIERVYPRWNNSFDYVVQHGEALAVAGAAFDSCQNEAVNAGTVALTNYPVVIWDCGNESTADETFSAAEQTKVTAFLAAGGGLFTSGAEIAWDLDRTSGPTASDRAFLNNQLHADFPSDTYDNAGSYTVNVAGGAIFAGKPGATFDDGSKGIYAVRTPDKLTPNGAGTIAALNYSGGLGGAAAIQYDGSAGGGRVVYFGFPYETIASASVRTQYMAAILTFLSTPLATNVAPSIAAQPVGQYVVQGSNDTLTVIASGSPTLNYQWRLNGVSLASATNASFTITGAQPVNSGNYTVVVTNVFGAVTSSVALVQVMLSPVLWSDNFDVNTAANWVTNRSSTDTRVTFNYNYAADGIPSAPNSSGGSTRGVKFEANMTLGVAAALNISPASQSFTGNYRLHFDMWINANGPFPAGGVGSTEHLTAGIGNNGASVQWTGVGSTANGYWFVVDGEGGSGDTTPTVVPDYGAYNATTIYATNSGVYSAGTGTTVRGNGNTYYTAQFPGTAAPALQQSTYPQQSGAVAAGSVGFAWRDIVISKNGSTVEWYIDGLKIASINGATFAANNIFLGYWDSYPSVSDNAALSFGLVDNVRVENLATNIPPYLTAQPTSAATLVSSNITLSVTAGGSATLAYQWKQNGTNIPGATSSSFTRNNVQLADAGTYAVLVTNSFGVVLSSNAVLSVASPQPLKFDLISVQPDQRLRILLSGAPGVYALQTSSNLTSWATLTNLSNVSGTVEFTDDAVTNRVLRFYRATQ